MSRSLFKGLNKPLKSFQGEFFVFKIFSIPNLKSPKFAVSISKKQEKKAVLRNKIRRISYKTIKDQISTLNLNQNLALHFILKQKPKDIKDDINRDVSNLISKISNLKTNT